MSKKVLVAVTGSTPQILTETVYGLYRERNWIPDEIHVLTTTHGRDNIQNKLFDKKVFKTLCDDYQLGKIHFSTDTIHVFKNSSGESLSDIKDAQDNDLAANMIVHFIHDLCQEPNNELHISLAGGRKSMGFYIGYALSLFGRQQDSMSHVLVDPDYERAEGFYYPTKDSILLPIKDREGNVIKKVDAKDAKIWLSDIPFVRMGVGYSPIKFDNDMSYKQIVALTQTAVSDFKVTLDIPKSTLECGEFASIVLSPKELSIYQLFIELAKVGKVFSIYDDVENACAWDAFSDEYLVLQKHYGNDNQKVEEQNKQQILDRVRETVSHVKKKLKENNLGPYVDNFGILSIQNGKAHLLPIKPENITIIEDDLPPEGRDLAWATRVYD